MTHHELAELLRDHVSHDEPPAPLPDTALTTGRRRLHARRLTAAASALAVLAVAGAVVGPRVVGDSGPDSAVDPVSVAALAEYDAHRMPDLMDQHVRQVLSASVPDLGPSRFSAMDAQGQRLTEEYWDKASNLVVSFGPQAHRYQVTISHARGEAEGDPAAYCADGINDGTFVDCTVDRTDDGDVVVSLLWALKTEGPSSWMVVNRDELATADLDDLWFAREVKVVKSETLVTYVDERVKVTDRDPALAPFTTSYDDLAAIGTDPELVMPVPPPGANGCPAWSLPADAGGMDVSCGRRGE